jgi:hypothetical protein
VGGRNLANKTVTGGTGWGAEFAKLCNKPLFVFDQDRATWSHWAGSAWKTVDRPVIRSTTFAGTGTRYINDKGKGAIEQLFADSFPA